METYSPVQEIEMDCPDCGFGSLIEVTRPFLRLYNNALFTIPRSLCYMCDTCSYIEFDESAYEIIYDMIAGSTQDVSQATAPNLASRLETGDELEGGHSQVSC